MSDEIKNNLEMRVKKHFSDSIETKQKAAEIMSEDIVRAINLMHLALSSDKKILACGNGSRGHRRQGDGDGCHDRLG